MATYFRALVVASAGLAACGGESGRVNGSSEGGGTAAGGDATGGRETDGKATDGGATGGSGTGGAGGQLTTGGSPSGGSGGALAGGSAGQGQAFTPGPQAQLDCNRYCQDFRDTHLVPTGCKFDAARPSTPDDCEPDQQLRCQTASDGDDVYLVNCECVALQGNPCGCAETGSALQCDAELVVCPCAVPLIL